MLKKLEEKFHIYARLCIILYLLGFVRDTASGCDLMQAATDVA